MAHSCQLDNRNTHVSCRLVESSEVASLAGPTTVSPILVTVLTVDLPTPETHPGISYFNDSRPPVSATICDSWDDGDDDATFPRSKTAITWIPFSNLLPQISVVPNFNQCRSNFLFTLISAERARVSPMESELKDLDPRSNSQDVSSKDDRPLLKSDSTVVSQDNLQELEKKFAAYVRSDAYGPMGCGELPLKEKLLLAFALVTLVPIRLVVAFTILVVYYLICRVCTLFSAPNREGEDEQEDYAHMGGWRRAVIVQCGRFLSRALLFTLGFYWINVTYRDPLTTEVCLLLFFLSLICVDDYMEKIVGLLFRFSSIK